MTINNPTMASEFSSERKGYSALTLNQKLETVSIVMKACQ